MRLKVESAGNGLHPSEAIVRVQTAHGIQEIVVDHVSARDNAIEVGHPIARSGPHVLVELPVETSSGAWRVWVHRNELIGEAMEAAE